MLEVREKNAPTTGARKHDISSWQEVDITRLNSKAKKRFIKYRSAVVTFFTTDKPIEEITARYHLLNSQLLKITGDCLKQHADGTPWGFRALLPGAQVKDHAPQPATETTLSTDSSVEEESSAQIDPSVETVSQSPREVDALEATAEKMEQPAEDIDASEITTASAEQSSEDVDELEITTKRPAIILNAPLESAAAQSAIPAPEQGEDEDEQAHSVAAYEPVTDLAPAITATTSSVQTSTPDYESALSSTESPGMEDETAATAKESLDTSTEEEPKHENANMVEASAEEKLDGHSEEPETPIKQEEPYGDDRIAFTPVQTLKGTEMALLPAADVAPPAQLTGPHLLPKFAKHGKRAALARIVQRRRMVRRRWIRDTQDKDKQKKFLRIVSITIMGIILLGLLLPIGVGLAAYGVYNNVNNLAHSGINHLLTVKDLLPISKSDPMAALNADKLEQAHGELQAAEADFEQLQQLTNRPDIQSLTQQFSPNYTGKLVMARHLVQVALDVSRMGQELSSIGVIAAGIVHSSPLASNSAKPLISVQDIAQVKGAIVHALYYIDDIQQNMSQVQLSDLPINVQQKAQLTSVLTELPTIRSMIVQNQGMVDVVTWLLGVGQPRHFLVQTMDNAELRPGGGFTGQYGLLTINNGRMDPFTLRDVALLDYAGNGMELGRQAPLAYRSWMNFGNWGLRDSNLSGDYPTTARMNMQVFQEEGGGPVDGDIAFTPTFIGHIIDVTGPIHVAEYNETITSANLADRLHYYQQDYNAIAIEHQKSNDNSHQARKAFTSLLGKLLLDRVRHLPTKQLLNVIKGAAKDLQSRDLEIYFNNTDAEQWLSNHGYSGGIDRFSKRDGFVLVQANISISKASQYVHTTEQDDITLDAQGGATHNLTITLGYKQTGPVYGYDTYADYMRVYVPHSSQLQSGGGFDSGHALCTASVSRRGKNGKSTTPVYSGCNSRAPNSSIYCPSGNYSLGMRGYQRPWTVDSVSGPTATTSDLPGRGMYGGLTATPKNCTATITLSWYVPNAVKHNGKHLSYTLFVQKQGGYVPTLDVTVDTSAIKGLKPLGFKGALTADHMFTLHN